MDRPHWPQEIVVKPMEEEIVVPNTTTNSTHNNNNNNPSKPSSSSSSFERRVFRPQKAATHVNCPRCDSTNTKFCYYNNYSLSQPRYFCKTCRRYWTEGGTLRNIPVGGGSRKNKRSSSSSLSSHSSVSKKLDPDLLVPPASTSVLSHQNPRIHNHHHHGYYGQDLNLGFHPSTNNFKNVSQFLQLPNFDINTSSSASTTSSTTTTTTTTTTASAFSFSSFMPISIPESVGQLMIPIPEFKIPSSLGFSLDGMESGGGSGYGIGNGIHESNTSGTLLFPFEELKTNTQTTHEDHVGQSTRDLNGDSNGFWNGMLGGGSW